MEGWGRENLRVVNWRSLRTLLAIVALMHTDQTLNETRISPIIAKQTLAHWRQFAKFASSIFLFIRVYPCSSVVNIPFNRVVPVKERFASTLAPPRGFA
jgi:hypothetical protein